MAANVVATLMGVNAGQNRYNAGMGGPFFSLQAVAALMNGGYFPAARRMLDSALLTDPNNARLHWQLGACLASENQFHLAHDYFRTAVRLEPTLAPAHAGLGALYLHHGIVDLALASSSVAVGLSPGDRRFVLLHARVLEAAGQIESAWDLARQLVDEKYINPGVVRLYGRMARYRNQQPAALEITKQLLATDHLPDGERAALHFTAADLLDSLGDYDQAFGHAAIGNAMSRPNYDPTAHERTFDQFIAYFTADRIARLSRSKEDSTKPVFIVGMPRSGTSLVEQILAAHPAVHGGGELDFMEHVFHGTVDMLHTTSADYPHCLDRLTIDHATGLSQIYLQPLIALSPNSRFITDKLPLNFLHLGLINLLMPGARIIHCRRNPVDTCLSCHMNSFAAGSDFKFDLTNLGLFYRQYQRLMTHWAAVLDLPMLDVAYEDLVLDAENQTRRVLEFLGLPFDPACREFHTTNRPVLTASLQQVRQPIYASSIGRSKHYQKHLGHLRDVLMTNPASP